ncbi:hypothetical protein HXK74_00935 [Candidatus Gracilibacteria bacterium]|nr:hypothetical protein [candidate division SR1 bacterium]MBF0981184.1 hypothetical protein [Candidatus Gracilibacteria bacterium]
MTNLALIQTKLPENLWGMAQTFTIDDNSLNQYSDLVVLILNSKSLSDNAEKQNWFNLLTIMNEEQILKLKEILTREKEKLEEINQKYAKKQEEINGKYQQIFNQQTQLQAKENVNRQQELEEADNLLAQI